MNTNQNSGSVVLSQVEFAGLIADKVFSISDYSGIEAFINSFTSCDVRYSSCELWEIVGEEDKDCDQMRDILKSELDRANHKQLIEIASNLLDIEAVYDGDSLYTVTIQ